MVLRRRHGGKVGWPVNLCTTLNLPPGTLLADIDPLDVAEAQERYELREQERADRQRDDELFNDHESKASQ